MWVLIQIREFNHCWVEISERLIKYLMQTRIDAGSSEVDTLYDCLLFETIEVCLWVKVFLQMKKKMFELEKRGYWCISPISSIFSCMLTNRLDMEDRQRSA